MSILFIVVRWGPRVLVHIFKLCTLGHRQSDLFEASLGYKLRICLPPKGWDICNIQVITPIFLQQEIKIRPGSSGTQVSTTAASLEKQPGQRSQAALNVNAGRIHPGLNADDIISIT